MRKAFIFMVLVVLTLSSFTKKQMAINYSQNQLKKKIMLDTTKWWLTKIYTSDSFMQVSTKKAFIRFNTGDGRINGNGSCNSFGGKLAVDGNNIKFNNIFSTKMYCNEVQPIEDEFFRQLQRVTGYSINGKKLILFNGEDTVLKFEAG